VRLPRLLDLKYNPVALICSEEMPMDAMQFAPGKWGCVMWLVVHVAKGIHHEHNSESSVIRFFIM
jgi:hypothetical protein